MFWRQHFGNKLKNIFFHDLFCKILRSIDESVLGGGQLLYFFFENEEYVSIYLDCALVRPIFIGEAITGTLPGISIEYVQRGTFLSAGVREGYYGLTSNSSFQFYNKSSRIHQIPWPRTQKSR